MASFEPHAAVLEVPVELEARRTRPERAHLEDGDARVGDAEAGPRGDRRGVGPEQVGHALRVEALVERDDEVDGARVAPEREHVPGLGEDSPPPRRSTALVEARTAG